MSVLDIDEYSWDIEFSSTHYAVWQCGYSQLASDELESFRDWFLTEFDKYAEFNTLMKLAGLQTSVQVNNDTIPGEYSIDTTVGILERMLEVVGGMLPQYPYIGIIVKRCVMENGLIYPILDIEFDREPFYTMQHHHPKMSLTILTKPEAGFRPADVFADYSGHIKTDKWRCQLREIHIRNFLGDHQDGPYVSYSYTQLEADEHTFH